jgi:hypothetical protein
MSSNDNSVYLSITSAWREMRRMENILANNAEAVAYAINNKAKLEGIARDLGVAVDWDGQRRLVDEDDVAPPPAPIKYETDDGYFVGIGDHVYNYYDMEPGRIEKDSDGEWFYFRADGAHGLTLLNGARICSLAHARRMGWKGV